MHEADHSPDDKLHPYYYHVYSQTLPPEQAYRIKRAEIGRVSTTLEESRSKSFMKRRRFIYQGYNNYTELEKEWILMIKEEMQQKHNIDLDKKKAYGPRTKTGAWIEGQSINRIA